MGSSRKARCSALVSTRHQDLCLEFANTRYSRGEVEPTETLHTLDDVFAWTRLAGALQPMRLDALAAAWPRGAHDREAFGEIIELREALYGIFAAIARRESPTVRDLDRLNGALTAAPARAELVRRDGGYVWRVQRLNPAISHLLAAVLWTAGDMLAEPSRDRVRLCANERCAWLFLDASKGGTRRWCSMSTCGNRAKAHRHYARERRR